MTDTPFPSTPTQPSVARIYDYMVFGKSNYEIDRETAHRGLEAEPTSVYMARENRAYLGRVVRFLAEECGIRQFIDHGSGLPTQDNVHQVAQRHQPDARVVYVDNDPIVLAHGRALLAEDDSTIVITADMSKPDELLGDPDVQRLIDFSQPVGLLYISALHCLPDSAGPWDVVKRMLAAVPSGSYLAVSAITAHTPEHAEAFTQAALNAIPTWGRARMPEETDRFFDGLEIVPPGTGDVATWRLDLGPALLPRPDSPDDPGDWPPAWDDDVVDPDAPKVIWEHGGVARKP